MQVFITLTPLMLFRSSNFLPFLRTSGLKKSIILGNKIKVKTNFWILVTCIFTYIQSVNLACVLYSYFCEIWFLETFKILSILSNVLCFALYGQYTIWFLNSINVLRKKKNSVCALDRFLPFHSKCFSMPD